MGVVLVTAARSFDHHQAQRTGSAFSSSGRRAANGPRNSVSLAGNEWAGSPRDGMRRCREVEITPSDPSRFGAASDPTERVRSPKQRRAPFPAIATRIGPTPPLSPRRTASFASHVHARASSALFQSDPASARRCVCWPRRSTRARSSSSAPESVSRAPGCCAECATTAC